MFINSALPEEFALLKNAERFLKILPYKNRWEIKQEELETQSQQCEKQLSETKKMLTTAVKQNVKSYKGNPY